MFPLLPSNAVRLHRSCLFVPATRPDRFAKAVGSNAGIVIVDLEDAVAPPDKIAARRALVAAAEDMRLACDAAACDFFVRVNAPQTQWHEDDVVACSALPIHGVLVPKPESASQVTALGRAMGNKRIHLLMETLRAFHNIEELANTPQVERLMLGCVDLMLELCVDDDGEPLHYFRTLLAMHSRLAGLQPPMDGVCLSLDDKDQLRREIERAKRFGFAAKACIHPSQVATVNSCFLPNEEEVAYARRLLQFCADGRATAFEGQLVDAPLVNRAKRVLGLFEGRRRREAT